MKAKDVMSVQIISVSPEATVLEAARLMLQNRISGLPVVNSAGKLVGIVSEGDFLRRRETGTQRRRSRWLEFLVGPGKLASEYAHSHAVKVSEVMSEDLATITENADLENVIDLMERRCIKRVPVVSGEKLVGIITRANLLHAMVSLARQIPMISASDSTIREQLLAELKKQDWAPAIDVAVKDGVVEFWGAITDERQREALRIAAESISGVKGIKDHLGWIEPGSGVVIPPPEEKQPVRSGGAPA